MVTTFHTHDGRNLTWPFDIEPRDVQIEALKKGFGKPGFAYFMRQRTGKTWTAYAEFVMLQRMGVVKWFIVICPNSLKQAWQDAIEEVDPFMPVRIYDAANKKKTINFFNSNKLGGAFIINYESVKSFIDGCKDSILPFDANRAYIVADESTKIKEPSLKSSKACIAMADACRYKRVLTGRPTANSNADIWSQLRFIKATERNFTQHKLFFCVMGGFQGRQVLKNINVEILQKEMEPVSYIADDRFVKGFKKVYEPMRRVNLVGKLGELYKKMQDELMFEAEGDVKITAPIMLTKYLRLQQISSGVAGDPDGMQHNLVPINENPRLMELLDIVEQEIENKVIIVCRFRLSIKNIYDLLTAAGYKVAVINGQMRGDQLEAMKKMFNEGNECNILVAQESVLNFGHTLCGNDEYPCDSMIFFENSFSLINRAQCESRPEKYGRDIAIRIFDMYASKMDRYILQSLIKKEDASLALMNYARENGMRPQGFNDIVDKEIAA